MEKDQHRKTDDETRAYLAKIQRTISESNALIAQAELRRAETDRMLAEQGLTREQVEALRFTPEQLKAVNAELARRGLPPIEEELVLAGEARPQTRPQRQEDARLTGEGRAAEPNFNPEDSKEDLENRRRKFNVMMNDLRL